ncbi:MAG: GtrA family protein [Eubacteriales bacterium]|nr:GtrA family protein [Eubacteriales bacterium]
MTKYKRVVTFGLVGCINTLVDFLIATGVHTLLLWSPGVSQTVGYCCGIVCSFLLNRKYTFRDGERRLWGQLILFIAVNLFTLGLSVLSIELLTGTGLPWIPSKILVTGLVMVCNYFGYKLIVFRVRS